MENKQEQELIRLEKKYWQAMKDHDMDTILSLTDDPCIIAGAQGVSTVEKKALSKMMQSPGYQLQEYKLDEDPKVLFLNENTAVVAYKVWEKLTVEGQEVTLEASDTSTWTRRDGQWVCALHTEAISGDPFGRDRRSIQETQ